MLFAAELVGIVVLRDVLLVGGAVYKRAFDLGWQVRLLKLKIMYSLHILLQLLFVLIY